MLTLYLDNSVYHHMYKSYGNSSTLRSILADKQAMRGKRVLLSPVNLDEIIPLLSKDLRQFQAKIRLMRSIADWDEPLKPVDQILKGDIRWYARYGETSGDTPVARAGTTVRALTRLALRLPSSPAQKDVESLKDLGQRMLKDKEQFRAYMDSARTEVLQIVKDSGMRFLGLTEMWEYSFSNEVLIDRILGSSAREAGKLKQCRDRGLLGLLDIRSVRMAVGFDLSYIFDMAFRKRQAGKGDPGDQHHAIYSSAAEVFVCEDKSLRKRLLPIPDRPVRILDIDCAIEWLRELS